MCRVDVPFILEMLGEEKRSMRKINLKKYPRQIQHHVTDLKMELFVKTVNTTGSEFASDYNKTIFLASNRKPILPFF